MVSKGKAKRRREANVKAAHEKFGNGSSLPPPPNTKALAALPANLRKIMAYKQAELDKQKSAEERKAAKIALAEKKAADLAFQAAKGGARQVRPALQHSTLTTFLESSGGGSAAPDPLGQISTIDSARGLPPEVHQDREELKSRAAYVDQPEASLANAEPVEPVSFENFIAKAVGRDPLTSGLDLGWGAAEEDEENKTKEKKRKREKKVGDWRVYAAQQQGSVGRRKGRLNEKKRKYLDSKKLKKKTKSGEQLELEEGWAPPPLVRFGEVVSAPPKLSAKARSKGNGANNDQSGPGAKTQIAHHWPETLGANAANKERLRQVAVEGYRQRRGWTARPGAPELPASLIDLD